MHGQTDTGTHNLHTNHPFTMCGYRWNFYIGSFGQSFYSDLILFLMGQFRPLFVYFRYFLDTISIIEKSVDGVLGIRTQGRRMVGADETTELWRTLDLSSNQVSQIG